MSGVFLKVVNMSISASWLILAVLAVRLCLRKAPKWVNILLWGLVAVRLLCPFSVESVFSLIPRGETIPLDIEMDPTPVIDSGITPFNQVVNPMIADSNTPMVGASANPLQITIAIYECIWLLGAAVLLCYAVISTISLRHKVKTAVRYGDNIFQSEYIQSPFVFGLIQPKIYLPYDVEEDSLGYILAHEQAHIRRRDHWWKPLGFLLLTVHWFNPLMWLSYVLLCRDIELACDEAVIRELDIPHRAEYSEALLRCSISRRNVAACPVAFGEVGVKQRVKSVLHYKKPGFWIVLLSVLLCGVMAVGFLTDPVEKAEEPLADGCYLTIKAEGVVHIEVTTPTHSGGLSNADGSPFEVGETVRLESLEPFDTLNDLRGVTVRAVNEAGETVYSISIPEMAWHPDIRQRLEGEWLFAVGGEQKQMTLEDVYRLSEKGYDLGWNDVQSYEWTCIGNGQFVFVFKIDEMFTLQYIGFPFQPLYLGANLIANDGSDASIDIRDGGVEEFVAEHRKNSVATNCTATSVSSPVGYNEFAFHRMLSMNYTTAYHLTSIHSVPIVYVRDEEQLRDFMDDIDPLLDFDRSYPDTPSFNDQAKNWDDKFFAANNLYLIYVTENNSAVRHRVEYVNCSSAVLTVGIQRREPDMGDANKEGWLVAVTIPKEQGLFSMGIDARISSTVSVTDVVTPTQ